MERTLFRNQRENAIDALISRVSESAVPANERISPSGRRKIEEKKKELLTQWAKATGNWHTDLSDFTDNPEPIGSGKRELHVCNPLSCLKEEFVNVNYFPLKIYGKNYNIQTI